MFDKLIESEPEGTDFKNRRIYFMVSSLVVGVLFTTAVVISIFAADFGLGSTRFELTEMIAPDDMAAVEPEKPQPRPPATTNQTQSRVPIREVNMERIDESQIAPITTSVVQNTQQTRPPGYFELGDRDTNPVDPGGIGRNTTGPGTNGDGLSTTPQGAEVVKEPEPPPVVKGPPVKPPTQSLGVINGRATSLPKPTYPATAVALNIQGKVNVQVLIDETGKVVSANAVNGHPFLKGPAEKAAWTARFSPTYLSKVAVKVTGVIVYNFSR